MKRQQTITGTLKALNREKSSVSGNPRFTLIIVTDSGDVEQVTTRPDSGFAYAVSNYNDKRITVTASMYRGRLSLDNIEGFGKY